MYYSSDQSLPCKKEEKKQSLPRDHAPLKTNHVPILNPSRDSLNPLQFLPPTLQRK